VRIYRWVLRLLPREFRRRREEDLVAAAREGWTQTAASGRIARLRFGAGLVRDALGMAAALHGRKHLVSLGRDARFVLRSAVRAPGFTLVAVVTLAIGIGATTTAFSFVNGFYFKASEFPYPARLVDISQTSRTELCAGCSVGTSYPAFAEWRERTTAFAGMAAYQELPVTLSSPLTPRPVSAARVTAGTFGLLGVAPIAGREFREAEDRPGVSPTVILGERLAREAFGDTATAIGRTLRVNGEPALVVGVMRTGFGFPEFAELWLPLHQVVPDPDRTNRSYGVAARLRPEVSIDVARAELAAVAAAQAREHPATHSGWDVVVTRFDAARREGGPPFVTLLGAVSLVLGVACANLAVLTLARSARRQREMALRAALGAGRGRLVQQVLLEMGALSAAGGLLGLLGAAWAVRVARALITEPVPYYLDFALDWRVAAFAIVAVAATALIVGVVPASAAARFDLFDALRMAGAAGVLRPRQRRVRGALVAVELALVLVLLAGAALMARTFLRFVQPPGGYSLDGLTLAQVPLGAARYDDEQTLRLAIDELDARLGRPDWRTGLAHTFFLAGFGAERRVIEIGGAGRLAPEISPSFAFGVTPGYFEAQGLSLIAGRALAPADRGLRIVVINEQLAAAGWPGASPIGAQMRLPIASASDWWTVVGVVSNADGPSTPSRRAAPYVYLPLATMPARPVDVIVRRPFQTSETSRSADVAAVGESLRATLAAIDADEPVTNVRSAREEHARQYWFVGYFATFYAAFAAFALLLAAIGVYGVVSQTVGERMREFGVRVALGADRQRLYRLVLGQAMRLSVIGIAAGLAGALALTRVLGALLFSTSPTDPLALGSAAAILAASAVGASYLPARRAARVDPLVVLKSE
jgi:putative ABC transport system permease protein